MQQIYTDNYTGFIQDVVIVKAIIITTLLNSELKEFLVNPTGNASFQRDLGLLYESSLYMYLWEMIPFFFPF